ncbi:hypothetical protein [Spiroplasma endosymbiont of Virgichneumon dumeticola]
MWGEVRFLILMNKNKLGLLKLINDMPFIYFLLFFYKDIII